MTQPTESTSHRIKHVSDALEDAVYLLDTVPEGFTAASCTLLPHPGPSSEASGSAKSRDGLKAG